MADLFESQISILADYYSNRCDAWGAYGYVYNAILRHRNERKYVVYMSVIKEVGKIWKSTYKTFRCKINENNNDFLLDDLNRHLYLNVIRYKKTLKAKYN